jgi:ABC-type multidrug transport system ATPase subunit
MLNISQVSKSYGARQVLRAVSLACAAGESVMVVGENGSGKSTLLKVAAGLIEADAGEVTLCQARVSPGTVDGRRQLGYLPDAADALPDLTVAGLVSLTVALKRARTPAAVVAGWRQRLGLEPSFGQRLRALSFGQRKRAFLLSALLGDPWLLVLDEPSNGLDPAGSALVAGLVRERRAAGLGTLVASNDAAFIRDVGGAVHRIVDGRLVATPATPAG